MKIAIFGASGKIGSKVVELLSGKHEIVKIGSRSGDLQADYTDEASVKPFSIVLITWIRL